jgi:hydroxymethylglutaryl-CoA lyase
MRDTAEVLKNLELNSTKSKLLAIVANVRGARDASEFGEISYLGYPFSISEIFQMRNTGKTIGQSLKILEEIISIASNSKKEVVAYLSMGFGNPYGDPWSVDMLIDFTGYFYDQGFRVIPIADVIGLAGPDLIYDVYASLIPAFPDIEFGIHLHTIPDEYYDKVDAAYSAGVRRFDTVLGGIGGCPMTGRELLGNLDTLSLVEYCQQNGIEHGLDETLLRDIAGKYSF